jgi:hypothetical protein
MSLRNINREPPDFAIRFVTDCSVMVRQKQHIYTDGRAKVGEIYTVKCVCVGGGGSIVADIDEVVIASGDYIGMSARTRMEKVDPDQALPN